MVSLLSAAAADWNWIGTHLHLTTRIAIKRTF